MKTEWSGEKVIAIVVEGGRVVDVYADCKDGLSVEVVDLDVNGDAEREAMAVERMEEIKANVAEGRMFPVL